MKVQTSRGLIERELLRVEEVIEEHDNARVVKTCWYLGDEEVRSDIHVMVLRGNPMKTDSGVIDG